MIILKNNIATIDDLENLYNDVGWISYTNDLEKLEKAFRNSLKVVTAWDDEKLVGTIRIVGDGLTIIYIQDILVLSKYHRKGIGKMLVNSILEEYKDVRQIVLMTDNEPDTIEFYKNVGFTTVDKYDGIAFVRYLL
ncbi:MAG: GNAT family N-acetyltransferase [Clostridium sp.]